MDQLSTIENEDVGTVLLLFATGPACPRCGQATEHNGAAYYCPAIERGPEYPGTTTRFPVCYIEHRVGPHAVYVCGSYTDPPPVGYRMHQKYPDGPANLLKVDHHGSSDQNDE